MKLSFRASTTRVARPSSAGQAILTLFLLGLILPLTPARTSPIDSTVRIGVFSLFHPVELELRPLSGAALTIVAGDDTLTLEGKEGATIRVAGYVVELRARGRTLRAATIRASSRNGEFVLTVPGKLERRFRGGLEVTVANQALQSVVLMDLETAVASVVAAESPAGAVMEALKAQAVAARSYLVAARGRHSGFDFCDTTHCQYLREAPARETPAAQASAATRGLVLRHAGKVVPAHYSASCGGRTRTLAELGLPAADYPYYAVKCAYCRRHAREWERRLEEEDALPLLAEETRERSRLEIGRRLGWNAVPGNNFEARRQGDQVVLLGRGLGHGLGLCQRGGAAMAAEGAGFSEILRHYYPNTNLAH
ncbi:MAG: SpoIID/LytB domain-containing protein [Acidobacteria bacterium]|nr:SpoIID/LytB domain-containing protein [Acidobacteriota bacterium]